MCTGSSGFFVHDRDEEYGQGEEVAMGHGPKEPGETRFSELSTNSQFVWQGFCDCQRWQGHRQGTLPGDSARAVPLQYMWEEI